MSYWSSPVRVVRDTTKYLVNYVASLLGNDYQYLVIPSFSFTNLVFNISSVYVQTYDYTIGGKFSLQKPFPIPSSSDFILCVSWLDDSNVEKRYKLWNGLGEFLELPLYNGETINASFRLEIWTLNSGVTTATLTSPYYLKTSLVQTRITSSDSPRVNTTLTPNVSIYSQAFPITFPISFTN